jgi:hypothetical protein
VRGEERFDMILGADFLKAHRLLFAMSQHRLYLSYLGGDVFQAPTASTPAPAASAPAAVRQDPR